LAALGVKLAGKDVALPDAGGKRIPVDGGRVDETFVCWLGVKGVHEVEMERSRRIFPEQKTAIFGSHLVPAHVRNFQAEVIAELHHLAFEESEAFQPRRFYGTFEKNLVTEADAEERAVLAKPFENGVAELLAIQILYAVAERPDTGKKETVDRIKVRGSRHECTFPSQELEDIENVLEVATSVVDDADSVSHEIQ